MAGLVLNDNSLLAFEVRNPDGTVKDLTGHTAVIRFQVDGGTMASKSMTITDASQGHLQYRLADSDLLEDGIFEAEITVTDTSGNEETTYRTVKRTARRRIGS